MAIINDVIYGDFKIDGLIDELIHTAAFQRLKGVHQGGAVFMVDPLQSHTRFEHSLGVYWLVTTFGGSLPERVAALLHDLSHTAFSHVGDYVADMGDEDYHESIFNEVIARSEIPDLLVKYGLIDALNHMDEYTLLEQPLPGICADRVDYTLRDLFHAGMVTSNEIKTFLADLKVQDNKLVITNLIAAAWFSNQYQRLNQEYFRKPEYLFANYGLTALLNLAISRKEISMTDLMTTDDVVIGKLENLGYGPELKKIAGLDGFHNFDFTEAAKKIKKRKITF